MVPASEETRIRSLAGMARALGRSEALFRLLEIAADEARTAMRAASVSVSRLVPGTLNVRTIVNVGDLGPDEVRWPEDEVYTIDEFAGLKLVTDGLESWAWHLDDPDCPAEERRLLLQLEKGSSLGAPLVVDGRLWGEFYATRHVGAPGFDDVDAAYMEALLAILSGSVSRALREESLEQLAYHDPLTGLLNRRALDEHAAAAFQAVPGRAHTVTAVTIDINRLKEVNDTLGHVAGDQLIQAVARDLQTAYGRLTGALVARVGGDEFTVLMTGSDPMAAVSISDELCRRIWKFGPGAGVSAGAASVVVQPGTQVTPTELFAAADRAQYVAKHGRLATTVMAEDFAPVPVQDLRDDEAAG
jgi:diguanylate cyclase (GGDEF)-like protein